MKAGRRFYNLIAVIVLIAATLFALYSGVGISYAATTRYSGVLDDLQEDSNFNVADYPAVNDDYNMQVIQVAESVDGELFVYVYQPAARTKLLIAGYLNMSLSETVDGIKQYRLTLLSSAGVFQKYLVNGLNVSSEATRYYNISNILRPFDKTIDDEPADGQIISEKPNAVGQLWTAQTVDGQTTYSVITNEVVEVTTKYVGYCVYDDGVQLGWGVTNGITKAYFVAFDTDRPIDTLKSADLIFFATRIKCKACNNPRHKHDLLYDFHDEEYIDFGTGVYNNTPLTIKYTQKFSNQGGGNVRPANRYTFNRIRTTADFIADNNNKDYQMTSGGVSNISGTKWVLNFYEAQDKYKENNVWFSWVPGISNLPSLSDVDCELNDVYDVEILRLEFETAGKPYNLGVVDNKQSPSPEQPPVNEPRPKKKGGLPIWAIILIACAAVLLVLTILAIFIPPIRPVIKVIYTILLYIIFSPLILLYYIINGFFIIIAKAVQKHKGKPRAAKSSSTKPRRTSRRGKIHAGGKRK
ncbi:MAG: hypothetical protein K2N23_05420 [Clostridia bacterium]|nr:hypothetical protein [Clostridia bacterium]